MTLRAVITGLMNRGETGWLLRHGAGLGGMRIFNIVAGLATTVLLARDLGVEGYGIYALALGWVTILGMPMQMGLPTLVMRQVGVYRNIDDTARLKGIVRWSFRLAGLSALLTALTSGAFGAYLNASGNWPVTASPVLVGSAFALLCLLALLSVYRSIICGFEEVVVASLPDTLFRPALLLFAIAVTMPFLAHDPGTVMALHALAALGATLLARSMAARRLREIEGDGTGPAVMESREWLGSLWPLTVQAGASIINSRLDIALLGVLSGPMAVALYDIGLKIASFSLVVQSIILPLTVAQFTRLNANGDLSGLSRLCSKTALLGSASVLIFLIVLAISGGPIRIIFGDEFYQAQSIAIVFVCGYLVVALSGPAVHVLNMAGREFRTMQFVGVASVLNIGLNVALIPAWGSIGAAISTVTSSVLLQLGLMLFAWKHVGIATDAFGWWRSRAKT